MSIFLFLKQIVDVLYPYKWLDYAMVIMAVVALAYQFLLVKPDLKKIISVTDICVLLITLLLTIHFVASFVGFGNSEAGGGNLLAFRFGNYVKPLSAVLLYFVGRIYYERIQECGGAMALASYLVVYANFIYRLVQHWGNVFKVSNAQGDLYYYDTDMAYAMLLALIFILMYGRNSILKLITIFFTIPYMVICSDAGIQKVFLIAILVLVVWYLLEKIGVPGKVSNTLLIVTVAGLVVAIGDLVMPSIFGGKSILLDLVSGKWLTAQNLYNSYGSWHKGWQAVYHAPILEKCIGIFDQGNNVYGNLYVRLLYSTGFLGMLCFITILILAIIRIAKLKDRKTCYVTILLGIIFLGTGVTTRCLEFTQMSWFVLMYLGMTITSVQQDQGLFE